MMSNSQESPIFVDAFQVVLNIEKLSHREDGDLLNRVKCLSIDLLETLTLALKGFDCEQRLLQADETLVRFKLNVRLLIEAYPERRGFWLQISKQLVVIGKQLGGWQKSLNLL